CSLLLHSAHSGVCTLSLPAALPFFTVLTEADAGRNRNVRLLDEQLGEFERTEVAERFRNRRPGKHGRCRCRDDPARARKRLHHRSEEHTSELQSRENLVCRLLLEKK